MHRALEKDTGPLGATVWAQPGNPDSVAGVVYGPTPPFVPKGAGCWRLEPLVKGSGRVTILKTLPCTHLRPLGSLDRGPSVLALLGVCLLP